LAKVPQGAWVPLGLAVILCLFFLFWSWAQGLENKFDADHRYRLTDVISRPDGWLEEKEGSPEIEEHNSSEFALGQTPVLRKRSSGAEKYSATLQLAHGTTKLERIPVFAFFHNFSATTLNGAPHSFSAFLKCYPSLPQVAVFLNIRVVGVAHTSDEERFVVSRVRSFDGIYVATLRLGYRDPIDLSKIATPIRDAIISIERRSSPSDAPERIKLIDEAMSRAVTHILPHFHILAAQDGNRIIRYIRTFFLESIFKRIKVNFDETDAFEFGTAEENVLRMGVAATL
jgi:KUP system potassium uptake protein